MTLRDTDERVDGPVFEIVTAVASATGTDPLSLDPPLGETLDVDALARLVETGSTVSVQFEYAGHTVLVRGDGTVTADRAGCAEPATGPAPHSTGGVDDCTAGGETRG